MCCQWCCGDERNVNQNNLVVGKSLFCCDATKDLHTQHSSKHHTQAEVVVPTYSFVCVLVYVPVVVWCSHSNTLNWNLPPKCVVWAIWIVVEGFSSAWAVCLVVGVYSLPIRNLGVCSLYSTHLMMSIITSASHHHTISITSHHHSITTSHHKVRASPSHNHSIRSQHHSSTPSLIMCAAKLIMVNTPLSSSPWVFANGVWTEHINRLRVSLLVILRSPALQLSHHITWLHHITSHRSSSHQHTSTRVCDWPFA